MTQQIDRDLERVAMKRLNGLQTDGLQPVGSVTLVQILHEIGEVVSFCLARRAARQLSAAALAAQQQSARTIKCHIKSKAPFRTAVNQGARTCRKPPPRDCTIEIRISSDDRTSKRASPITTCPANASSTMSHGSAASHLARYVE